MRAALLATSLLAATAAAQEGAVPEEQRTLLVTVTDDKGQPLTGLTPEELVVLENGAARTVTRVDLDQRPLTAAILVDTSLPVGSLLRLHVIDPVASFAARLPEGSVYALWTTGDRPTKKIDFTDDTALVRNALRTTPALGGNTILDAIVEAGEDLKKREGERTAMFVITGQGTEFSSRDRFQVVERAKRLADGFWSVQYREALAGEQATLDMRIAYEHVLGELAKLSGGLYETTLSAMGTQRALEKISQDLRAQHRLLYSTVPGLKERKVEVTVARPGVKARVAVATLSER
jgi:VWFA-related protein